jgi:hypothetical protein
MILNLKRIIDQSVQLDDNNYTNSKKVDIINTVKITEMYLYRWDKLSFDNYGDSSYGMLLYIFNEYTHPYEIEIDDIILIPDLTQLQNNLTVDNYDNSFKSDKFTEVSTQASNLNKYINRKTPTSQVGNKRSIRNDTIIIR